MTPAPIPADETLRLAAVRALNLLDSARESRFDRITRLAATLFKVPYAYISLVDEHRQWFKSSVGLSMSEVPREVSFCSHVILQAEPLIVPNAPSDRRFADNPIVIGEPAVRFYAGRALNTRDGIRVGTLSIMDRQPRRLTQEELRSLHDLADLAQVHLDEIGLDDALNLLMEADRARAEQKRIFDAFMENTPCVVFIKDQGSRFLYVNRRFEDAFELSSQEVLGKCDLDWLPADAARQNMENDRRVLESGKSQQVIELVPTPDGKVRNWLVIKFPLLSPQAEPLVAGVALDVTTEKQAERAMRASEERYRDLFENACDMIACCDAKGRFIYANPAWHDRHGYSQGELVNRCLFDLIAPDERERTAAMFSRVIGGENLLGVAIHLVTREGRQLLIEGNLSFSLENAQPVARGMFRDITARELAQQKLRASEQRLAMVVRGADVGTWDWHIPSGRITFNDRWATMLGYLPIELAPHVSAWQKLVHPDDRPRIQLALDDHIAGRTPLYETEHRVRGRDGTWYWILDRGCVTERDEDGKPLRAAGTHLDITVRKKAEIEVNRLIALQQAILDSANSSIVSTSPDGIILTFNSTAERWLGYSAADLIGRHTPELFHAPEEIKARSAELAEEYSHPVEPNFETFVYRAKLGHADEREWTYIRKDGSRFPVRLSVTALIDSNGAIFGFVGVARDITAEKVAAEAMRQAKEAAELANQTKSRFLANMSHEVRTPLNGILGVNSMLLETPLSIEQRQLTEIVRDSGESLLAIVNDILDFSKVESGLLELERTAFGVAELVDGLQRLHHNRARIKGLTLEARISPDAPPRVIGDPVRIRQILNNFIGNAIKFSFRGTISIEVEPEPCVDPDGRLWLRFSVKDRGIGVSPDAQTRIFDPFQQADSSTTRKYGGTGLGLSICKELVTLMGGEIGLESESGVGSTFWFVAPLQVTDEHILLTSDHSETTPPPEYPGLKILVAEDSPVNQMVIAHELRKLGCEVLITENGREAVEAFTRKQFDLVLMDCQMPEMDGYEAATEIRRSEHGATVPIIAITANAMTGQRDRCLAVGMNEYVSKPFSRERLLSAVANVLVHRDGSPESCLPPAIDEKELAGLRQEGAVVGVDLISRLAEAFEFESTQTTRAMQDALQAADSTALARTAHKLRGSGANFGAHHLERLCEDLEKAALAGTIETATALFESIKEETCRVLAAVSSSAAA